jgi:ADP-heptose:LPS heptosyltransferase
LKKALLARLGAFGDMIILSPVFPMLKRDGYHVTLYMSKRAEPIIRHNPYIDKVIYHDESIPIEKLWDHLENLGKGYDKFIHLSESIEGTLLYSEKNPAKFNRTHEQRHAECNVNYYDRTLELCGYPNVRGFRGQLYFSPLEYHQARKFRQQNHGKFFILWSLSGSSFHKTYPHAENVARAFCEVHKDAVIVTVGDDSCLLMEWDHEQTFKKSGVWNIRRSMLATKFADLVISTETGILNAAGCFDTPKIALLSHSSVENLTKYFKNCINLNADVPCYPCHRLIYTREACPLDTKIVGPVCMAQLSPAKVLNAMEDVYKEWKEGKYGSLRREERSASVCA